MASTTIILTASAAGSQAKPRDDALTKIQATSRVLDETAPSGPAPDWFKNPQFKPSAPRPQPEINGSGGSAVANRESEPFVAMPYCRGVYGHMYWMSTSANLGSCTQGYMKYYDSRNGDYLAFDDVYMHNWKMTRSAALSTAYGWCSNNFICSIALEAFLLSKVKPVWTLVRQVRFGL